MSISDLRAAPFPVVREQALRFLAELEEDAARVIVGPLESEAFDVAGLVRRLRTTLDQAALGRSEQATRIAGFRGHTDRVTAAVDEASRYLRSVRRRAQALVDSAVPAGTDLLRLLGDADLPNGGAAWKEVTGALENVGPYLGKLTGDLPGFPKAFRQQAAVLRDALLDEVRHEEGAETTMEASTAHLHGSRARLTDLCADYLRMRAVVNGEREDRGEPLLPGGNLEQVAQWAATRPSELAARAAELPPIV